MSEYTYLISPDFDPTVVPEGYIWDENAFKELVKATDKASADQTIYTYGGVQGDADVVYENAADLTISNEKYNAEEQIVDTTVTANTFNNTGTVTTEGAITFSLQNFSNSGTFNLDNAAFLTAIGAITNMVNGTIQLNSGSTLQGATISNAGTITVASDYATLKGAIINKGLINSVLKCLTVTGDIQNGNADDTTTVRDNTVIKVKDFSVTGNILNYGIIGTEIQQAHKIDISGELRNYRQVIVDTLTVNSIYNDRIDSDIEEKRTLGYIIARQIVAREINNVAGEICTRIAKEDGKGIDASGKINNGTLDATSYSATIEAGDNGWIQATDALNNIGASSFIHAGYITVVKNTEAGDLTNDGSIMITSITVDGSVTNSATGVIEINSFADKPGNLSATSIENDGTINLSGPDMTLAGYVVNNNLFNFDGTVTATSAITNTETGTISIKSNGTIADNGVITNNGTLHIAIQEDNKNKITADKFYNTEGVGKITISGSCGDGVTSVISAKEGDVKVSDITLSVTSKSGEEVTAVTRDGNLALASSVDYSTIYLSNCIDEDGDFAKEVKDSSGASYYVDFNAFQLPTSAQEDGVKDTTTTILIDGTTAAALKYESETTASIDGLVFAKDGANAASPDNEEKNVEFVLTGMNPLDPKSYRDLKNGITVGTGVTLTVDNLHQTAENAVTNINGELRIGAYNTGIEDDPTTDVDESVASGTFRIASGQVNVNSGGALYGCTVLSGGKTTVYEGGYAEDVTVEQEGALYVHESGAANDTTVNCGGKLYVSNGGVANGVTVNSGGTVETSNGIIDGATVHSGGCLLIYSGTKMIGKMTFEDGAEVIPFVGSILDFDLTQTKTGVDALVDDISVLMGTPTYTLTVDGTQDIGTYNLAGGAARFNKTISVVNTQGAELGTLTLETPLVVGDIGFMLSKTDSVLSVTVGKPDVLPTNLAGKSYGVSWDSTESTQYSVEFSTDNFENVFSYAAATNSVDIFGLTANIYQWRARANDGVFWANGEEIVVGRTTNLAPQVLQSDEDGNADLFFAHKYDTWDDNYQAKHVGLLNGWEGTGDIVLLEGKNHITDVFQGTTDPNLLCLTDDANGDALFVDDIYSELPDSLAEQQARIAQIKEIRAGLGDDIIDMTSQRFKYIGAGLTVRGGLGNDVIWSNTGDNLLFGDEGDDRIVGASGNDVLAGGTGNDTLHGGGGEDIFAFGGEWGNDTVKQLADGKVTLWFKKGDDSKWNADKLTYTDGDNSVTVTGVSDVTLKFGDDGSEQYQRLLAAGTFSDATSQRIFEERDKGMLA